MTQIGDVVRIEIEGKEYFAQLIKEIEKCSICNGTGIVSSDDGNSWCARSCPMGCPKSKINF